MIDYKYRSLRYFDDYDTPVVIDSNVFITPKIRRNIMPRVVPNVGKYTESTLTFFSLS
jgi:hypothetical protein